MSTSTDFQAMQRELLINREIENKMNEILPQMQSMLEQSRIWESNMELHQIQNLLATAQETRSVEVVKNYVLYQIGRDSNNGSWRRHVGKSPNFGEQIVAELDSLQETAKRISDAHGGDKDDASRAWMTMTRLYLGYLRRYFYYKKRTEGKN